VKDIAITATRTVQSCRIARESGRLRVRPRGPVPATPLALPTRDCWKILYVLNVRRVRDRLGNILGPTLVVPAANGCRQGDFAIPELRPRSMLPCEIAQTDGRVLSGGRSGAAAETCICDVSCSACSTASSSKHHRPIVRPTSSTRVTSGGAPVAVQRAIGDDGNETVRSQTGNAPTSIGRRRMIRELPRGAGRRLARSEIREIEKQDLRGPPA
jgi:hypothetical protein